jgi:hypothetical protein
LATRGLTNAVIDEAKALVQKLRQVDGPLPDLEKWRPRTRASQKRSKSFGLDISSGAPLREMPSNNAHS